MKLIKHYILSMTFLKQSLQLPSLSIEPLIVNLSSFYTLPFFPLVLFRIIVDVCWTIHQCPTLQLQSTFFIVTSSLM